MSPRALLLQAAFGHRIAGATIEEAHDVFLRHAGAALSLAEFAEAAASAQRDGLIEEPVILPEGALSCHWRLVLTQGGVALARSQTS